jgi:hypothetical protein
MQARPAIKARLPLNPIYAISRVRLVWTARSDDSTSMDLPIGRAKDVERYRSRKPGDGMLEIICAAVALFVS